MIDLDSQANLSMICGKAPISQEQFENCHIQGINAQIDILPATKSFPIIEDQINRLIDRNAYLKDRIVPKILGYDYVIIDTSPSLSILNINAFMISDYTHIIVNPDSLSVSGMIEVKEILGQVKKFNTKLDHYLVMNAFTKGRNFSEEIADRLREDSGYTVEIPHRQYIIDSNARQKPAIDNEEIYEIFKILSEVV
jgi:chromosome partitioning protein